MPKTDIRSYWSSGDLIFYEKGHRADEDYHVLEIADGEVIVGNADNDVDFIVYLGAADQYVKFDCGTAAVSFAKVDVTITGDLTIDTEDINLGDNDDLEFGDSQDVLMRFSTGDASNPCFVLALDDTSQQMHITDKGAVATDWARSAGTHPELAIHSNTTPITDYLAIGNHDGTTAHINVVGGTTLSLDIAGTAEVTVTADATSPATTDSNALGTTSLMWSDLFLAEGAVINFNNGNVTVTHSAGGLAIAGAAVTINDAGADLDFRVESDNLAYALYLDGGKDSLVLGSNTDTSSVDQLINITRAARTATANTAYYDVKVTPAGAVTVPTGTTALVAEVRIDEPNITATGTVTEACTLYVGGAPTEGGSNYALHVAGGNSLFAGTVAVNFTGAAASTKAISTSGFTLDAANLGDGYGAVEVDLTLTGVSAGHNAALSAWLNLPSGTASAGNYLCAQTNGIYEDAGVTMNACDLIFGLRASAVLGDTTGWGALAPFSLNTGNKAITALFQIASAPAIGYAASSPSSSACGTIPIFCDAGGTNVKYLHVYPDAS